MPGSERAEVYFIAAMMVLILILSFAAIYFFVRQYKREMRDKNTRSDTKKLGKQNGDRDAA